MNDVKDEAEAWDCHVHVFDGAAPALDGHYVPPRRTLAMLDEAARPLGIGHYVLVQPSVYGTDNRLMLEALRASGGRHRGVVVIAPEVSDGDLDAMHEAGVRGVRFNLVSPVGNSARDWAHLAPRLQERGWHAQWYAPASQLAQIVQLHEAHRVTAVLDHLAGMSPAMLHEAAVWDALRSMSDTGAWIKLSGWYRLHSEAPFEDMVPLIERAVRLFGERCVWGSDWPHTWYLHPGSGHEPPAYADLWQPVRAALSQESARAVFATQPARLYR
ncbi:MAG: amidohydrolase family protein [Ramlibacter sp.]